MSREFCIIMKNFPNQLIDGFRRLLSTGSLLDVTLSCGYGLSLEAHKVVLAAGSPYFKSLFSKHPCEHPIVALTDVKYAELKVIVEFMYHGEVTVPKDQLPALLKAAESLQVTGLLEEINKKCQADNSSQDEPGLRSMLRMDSPLESGSQKCGPRKQFSLDSNLRDYDANKTKIKQPVRIGMVACSQFSKMQSLVPMHSTPLHSSSSFSNTCVISPVLSPVPEIEYPSSTDESEFKFEPAKLEEQTFTVEELMNRSNRTSGAERQRRITSSSHHGTKRSLSSDIPHQRPDSPPGGSGKLCIKKKYGDCILTVKKECLD